VYHGYDGKGLMLHIGSEIIDAVLPYGGMALMLHAYFDESGTHYGSPRMCVAGYLIDSIQAKKMNDDWGDIQRRYGFGKFHMQECAHRVGEFKDIPKEDCVSIAKSLIELIKLRVEVGIAVSISEPELKHRDILTGRPAHILSVRSGACRRLKGG
jgi:hypothetical protein